MSETRSFSINQSSPAVSGRHRVVRRLRFLRGAGSKQLCGYWKRRKTAVALLSAVQLPAMIWAALYQPRMSVMLGLGFMIWLAVLVRSHMVRGWSVRLPAEVVADLLNVALPAIGISVLLCVLTHRPIVLILVVHGFSFFLLSVHALFWRGRPKAWVRIVGSPSNCGAAVRTFGQCMDLLGRDGCRFAPFRADRPEPEAWERRIAAWLDRGETVLVLEPRLRPVARRMKDRGDVLFAEDCLLFAPMARPAGPVADRVLGVFNCILAFVFLGLFAPLALLISVLVKMDDGGPILFAQDRVGRGGRRFVLYKFRTMRTDAPRYAVHPNGDDPRITRVGKYLRKLSLDELPQIINVMRGEMRLVGPRPEMPFLVEKYDDEQRRRLDVTPGITGLWQVSPHRNDPIHEHIEYDLAYIAHRGPILDLALVIATTGLANSSGN